MKLERRLLDRRQRAERRIVAIAPRAHFSDRGEQLEPLGWGYVTPLY
jgi:hypothetical protein